jgi:hypothetical protein
MITKKQWAQFCMDVQKAKARGLEPYIKGQRVISVDTYNNVVVTSLEGESRTKYIHSSTDRKTVREVYSAVKLQNVKLIDMRARRVTEYML